MPQAADKAPSILQQRADAVHRCIKELESQSFQVKAVTIEESQAIVLLKASARCQSLPARDCGVVNTTSGRYTVMQFQMYDVCIQWLRPFHTMHVIKNPRMH